MSLKTAVATLADDRLRFEVATGSGHTIVLDDGEGNTGPRPAEMVGVSLAACTAMDVISILRKKRQAVSHYEVRVSGVQGDGHPHAFSRFEVVHVVDGEAIDPEAVRRAIELSATRYCAVSATLATGAVEIRHAYLIRQADDAELSGDVVVTGPNLVPDAAEAS
jgi:putative redox protein